jgi:hypothetical protein
MKTEITGMKKALEDLTSTTEVEECSVVMSDVFLEGDL